MSGKWILYIPVLLIIIGAILGIMNEPDKDWAFFIGSGLGLVLISAVPGAIFGSIHYFFSKKKRIEVDLDDQLLDTSNSAEKKIGWYPFFSVYTGGFGVFFTLLILLSES